MRRDDDYLVIQGWMLRLGLTGKQRDLYALIWGFSRNGKSRMRGTAKYIADWCECSERHAKRLIRELEDRGLVEHEVVTYYNKKTGRGGVVSEFWAVLPEDAEAPERGEKDEILWTERLLEGVGTRGSLRGRDISAHLGDPDVPTFGRTSRYSTVSNIDKYTPRCGGKYSARGAREENHDHHHDLNLFSEMTGASAGALDLPFLDDAFEKSWSRLLATPAWEKKNRASLQMVLDDLAAVSLSEAVYCCDLTVRKGWDDMNVAAIMSAAKDGEIPSCMSDVDRIAVLESLLARNESQEQELQRLLEKTGGQGHE